MIPLPLGLLAWSIMGLTAGLSAAKLLPGEPSLGAGLSAIIGLAGALVGGFLATVLGFGGVAGYDFRGLLIATLASIFCLLVLRLVKLEG